MLWGGKLRYVALAVAIACASVVLGGISPRSANAIAASAIISNGTVQVGVWEAGHLNVPGGTPSSGAGNTTVGLRYVPTNAEATADGCTCEGWGAADATTSVTGYANDSVDGVQNIAVDSFTSTATTAVSTVHIGTTMRVVHDYHPSSNPNLYEVSVSITNISAAPIHLLYRRVMDWDIEPTAFSEFVTMEPGTAPELVYTSDGGFATANPLGAREDEGNVGTFVDAGPDDHGALFDFDFGSVPAGFTKQFKTYYGAAGTEKDALAALSAVGAQAYSLGQPSTPDGPTLGTPNTFMFGFGSISSVAAPLTPVARTPVSTPCIGGIVTSRCPGNPPEVKVTVTPVATETELAAPTQAPPTATAVPPTATPQGGGASGQITAPNTGSGPGGSGTSTSLIAIAALVLAGGAAVSLVAARARRT